MTQKPADRMTTISVAQNGHWSGSQSAADSADRSDRRPIFRAKSASWLRVTLFLFLASITMLSGQATAQIWQPSAPTAGSSSRELRQAAAAAIPMDRLTPEAQQKISRVIEEHSMYRQLPSATIETDADMLVLLARYPEIVVEIWNLMGVTQMKCERTGAFTIRSDDAAGTVSELELVYGTESIHVFFGTGTYTGNLIRRPIDAECVLILRTAYGTSPGGETIAANTLDVFMKIDNAVVGLAAKTVLPLFGQTADHNFVETLRFVERLNNTTQNNGPGVQGMAYRLEGLVPDVRQQFVETAGLVYDRAVQRATALTQPSMHQVPSISRSDFPGGDSGTVDR